MQPEPEPEPEAIEPPELCVWRVPPALLAEVLALRRQVCRGTWACVTLGRFSSIPHRVYHNP